MRLAAWSLGPLVLALARVDARAQTPTRPTESPITASASNNPHGTFSAPCAQCHLPDAWRPARVSAQFKHAPARFPLAGAHSRASCATCHKRLDFAGVNPTCASCHRDAHQGELGATCATCHTQRSFLDLTSMRRAHQLTAFPLMGSHARADCRSCHTPKAPGRLAFANIPMSCVSCHQQDYNKATTPSHAAAGFSSSCETCHTQAVWAPARFSHAGTRFPLTGAHTTTSCARCHSDGVYRGKPATCLSCHQANYAATTNPNHTALGFSTDCSTCHTTTRWVGATFNHDAAYFPIYSGAHAHKWTSCATCHSTPTNYTVFNCLGCHLKTKTDADHRGKAGYVYASPNCYSCHPRGKS